LASVGKPEAYRAIERYSKQAPAELKEWSLMALQESRMLLESQLLDEQQIFISTGLGGMGGKLRYFVAFFPESGNDFTPTQQKLLENELEISFKKFKCDMENLSFHPNHASLLALIPINVHVRQPFVHTIEECNSLGFFVKENFLITNVKRLSWEEIEVIKKSNTEEQDGNVDEFDK
jgi:hypothetical protein